METKNKYAEFEVNQLPVAKKMIYEGARCIGVRLNTLGYMVFQFERTDRTREAYAEAKRQLGK